LFSFKEISQRVSRFPDIPGSQCNDHVSRKDDLCQVGGDFLLVGEVGNIPMPVAQNPFVKELGVNSLDGRFTRRIDIGYDQLVCLVETAVKILREISNAGKPMGLKNGDKPTPPATFGGAEGCFDLPGMMTVIVDDEDIIDLVTKLKSTLNALKILESAFGCFEFSCSISVEVFKRKIKFIGKI